VHCFINTWDAISTSSEVTLGPWIIITLIELIELKSKLYYCSAGLFEILIWAAVNQLFGALPNTSFTSNWSWSHVTTDGQPVSTSWCRAHCETCDQILILSESCWFVSVGSPLWREVGSVSCQSLSAVIAHRQIFFSLLTNTFRLVLLRNGPMENTLFFCCCVGLLPMFTTCGRLPQRKHEHNQDCRTPKQERKFDHPKPKTQNTCRVAQASLRNNPQL
jgi:hypothetical protein